MYTSKSFLLTTMVVAMSFTMSFAQSGSKTDSVSKRKQSVVLTLGGGIANYLSHVSTPQSLQGSVTKVSPALTFRAMWHPGFRLNLGIQSGYTSFYSYRVKNNNIDGKQSLTAVPILVVWSMPIVRRVNIFGGFGSYLLTTHLDYKGVVESSTMSLGSNLALSYTMPVSKNLGLAAEAEWLNGFETKDQMLAFKINLVWNAFQF
jgi:hypothetical protein